MTPLVKPELSGLPTAPDAPEIIGADSGEVLRVGQVVSGRYEVIARLGAGGMGAVWRVHDRALNEDVALKAILPERVGDPKALERFRGEVKIARKITHPNVCRVFDLGQDDGLTFLTMELVEGTTLRHLLAEGPLEPARALDMLQQIAGGVAAAHERGVIHRDLKPENVLVRRDGGCLVADFGLAREPREPGVGAKTTAAGAVGTPAYMSPEQLKGEKLDIRSDVFALGIIGYELLSGRSPFGQGSHGTVSIAILRSEPPPLEVPGLSEPVLLSLREVFSRALAKDPDARLASANELGEALVRARNAAPARTTMPGLSEAERASEGSRQASRPSGETRAALVILALVALAAVGFWSRAAWQDLETSAPSAAPSGQGLETPAPSAAPSGQEAPSEPSSVPR